MTIKVYLILLLLIITISILGFIANEIESAYIAKKKKRMVKRIKRKKKKGKIKSI